MPILLFLIDTSASMNQRTDLGTSYLDIAKGAVELFLKVMGAQGGGRGRDGACTPGMVKWGIGVLSLTLARLLPAPHLDGLRHPRPAAARPGPGQPRRQVHAGHLRRTAVLHQGKGASEGLRWTGRRS